MNITYYTIDDLRKGRDEKGVTGRKLSRFLGRNDALLHYRSLPRSGIKVLGIRTGKQDIDLIRCIRIIYRDTGVVDGAIGPDEQQPHIAPSFGEMYNGLRRQLA